MILVLIDPIPSDLLEWEESDSCVLALVQRAISLLKEGKFQDAESRAQMALETARQQRQDRPLDLAIVSLCLSDIYRETGRILSAISMASQAYEIFQRQPSPAQRHNEAIAAYGLALLHHGAKDYAAALRWYETARRTFGEARRYWLGQNMRKQAQQCEQSEQRILFLSRLITAPAPFSPPVIFLHLYAEDRFLFPLDGKGYRLSHRIVLDDRAFQVMPPPGTREVIWEQDAPIGLAVPIPDPICPQVGAQAGDLVLAQQCATPDPNAPLWVAFASNQSTLYFGQFQRQPDGTMQFQSMYPRIIGGSPPSYDDFYRPIGILRPLV